MSVTLAIELVALAFVIGVWLVQPRLPAPPTPRTDDGYLVPRWYASELELLLRARDEATRVIELVHKEAAR